MLEGLDRAQCADGSECNNIVEALCYVVDKANGLLAHQCSRYVYSLVVLS